MSDAGGTSTIPRVMSAIETRTQTSSRVSLPIDYSKRLMLCSGRANPQLVGIEDELPCRLADHERNLNAAAKRVRNGGVTAR